MAEGIEKSVEVDVPVRTAYDQWTQFEEFPQFMDGVDSVRQLDDTRLHWVASIAGVQREWDAEIVEQVPDQVISWRATGGTRNDGVVRFESLGADRTRVTLLLDVEPEGFVENVGDKLGFISKRAEGDLKNFKKFIEARGTESGAWRGEVHGGQTTGDSGTSGLSGITSGSSVSGGIAGGTTGVGQTTGTGTTRSDI
jgi:uncharacterized membrane protein